MSVSSILLILSTGIFIIFYDFFINFLSIIVNGFSFIFTGFTYILKVIVVDFFGQLPPYFSFGLYSLFTVLVCIAVLKIFLFFK